MPFGMFYHVATGQLYAAREAEIALGPHEPASVQTLPQPWQGTLKQLFGTHEPAFGPKFVQTSGASQVTPKHGALQPFCPLHVHSGTFPQFAIIVPVGAHSTVPWASIVVFAAQLPQLSAMQ